MSISSVSFSSPSFAAASMTPSSAISVFHRSSSSFVRTARLTSLPQEAVLKIISFLSPNSLAAMQQTCKEFNNLILQNSPFWQKNAKKDFGKDFANASKKNNPHWKTAYDQLATSRKDAEKKLLHTDLHHKPVSKKFIIIAEWSLDDPSITELTHLIYIIDTSFFDQFFKTTI